MIFQILLTDHIDVDLKYDELLWKHVTMNFSDIAHKKNHIFVHPYYATHRETGVLTCLSGTTRSQDISGPFH